MSSTATTPVTEILNYYGGAWQKSSATDFVNVNNPATGDLIGKTPLSSKADVDTVVKSASDAFPAWRRTPAGERIQYLFKLKYLLEEHIDELSRLITLENGKTFGEAKAELRRGIENVEVACGIPMMMQGYNLEDITPGVDETMIRQPLGVVAAIVPFNFPAMIPFWFLPYAIACGNTFVLKPSERVPITVRRIVELVEKTGIPKGVVNVVNGGRSGRCALRSFGGAGGQLCRVDAGGETCLRAVRGGREAQPMPGRGEEPRDCAARCGYGSGEADHQRFRVWMRGAAVLGCVCRGHHWRSAEDVPGCDSGSGLVD